MDESTSSGPRTGVVSASAVQMLLDSLVVAQPFQSGGSLADDLLLAVDIIKRQLGEARTSAEYAFNAISRRVDNAKRFKTKCDLISTHRPSQYELYLVLIMKLLEDPSMIMVLKTEAADLSPGKAEAMLRETISKVVRVRGDEQSVTTTHEDEMPHLPYWFAHRPGLSEDFIALNKAFGTTYSVSGPSEAPLAVQEQLLVDEYLYAMMGIESQYLVMEMKDKGAIAWRVLRDITPVHEALVGLVERMLPLCECYVEISKFVDDFAAFECGMIAHALSAAVSVLLRDYLILVAQLEQQALSGSLSLQKIWFYIQTSLDSMLLLRDITREARFFGAEVGCVARFKFGAELLNLLHNRWLRTVSDKSANDLFLFLLQKACAPYWEMLKSWIYKGFVKDPYGEFLIEENRSVHSGSSETYWDKKYCLRPNQIPIFLDSLKDRILTTGKYINAIRECGMHVNQGETLVHATSLDHHDHHHHYSADPTLQVAHMMQVIEEFNFSANERVYAEKIDRAYQYASGRLLHLLRTDYGLMAKLRSVKHYFLLDQGDFFIHFMDVAEDELKPPAAHVQPSTLQTLVDIAIRASVAKDDELGESMKIKLLPFNLVNQLIARHRKDTSLTAQIDANTVAGINSASLKDISALEALTLDWHLFYCKHVERILGRAWTQHQVTKQLFLRRRAPSSSSATASSKGPMNRSKSAISASSMTSAASPTLSAVNDAGSDYNLLTRCFSLRQRMLHFIQNFQYYMVMEVIEPRYLKLEETLKKATTVDELLEAHNNFLSECHRNCLLTEMDLFKIITKILSVCVIFCNYTERFIKQLTLESQMDASKVDPKSKTSAANSTIRSRNNIVSMEGRKLLSEKGFGTTMARFEANFDKYYRMLMEATTTFQNPHFPDHGLLALNIRLDFNDYYSEKFQQF